jgi:predicted nucleic acid-binding protein
MRKGESVMVSDLLVKETANLSDEQIKNMIASLTGAIDGTYTDEASAVKVAIMKAVKELG